MNDLVADQEKQKSYLALVVSFRTQESNRLMLICELQNH